MPNRPARCSVCLNFRTWPSAPAATTSGTSPSRASGTRTSWNPRTGQTADRCQASPSWARYAHDDILDTSLSVLGVEEGLAVLKTVPRAEAALFCWTPQTGRGSSGVLDSSSTRESCNRFCALRPPQLYFKTSAAMAAAFTVFSL